MRIEKLIQKVTACNSDIRFSDIEMILNHFDYVKVRQKGSHAHFRKNNSPFTTLPFHSGVVKKVYIKEILKILNI